MFNKIIGQCNLNASLAAIRYAATFPNRYHPKRKFFTNLVHRLRERGSFKHERAGNCGRYNKLQPHQEEEILRIVHNHPDISTRMIAFQMENYDINRCNVHQVLKRQSLYPYHVQKVQALMPHDYEARTIYCQWPKQ